MTPTDLAKPDAEPAPLPLSATDLALVDGAVAWLNRAVQASGVQLAVEVSGYILASFFGGDFAAFSDTTNTKSVSFRSVVRHRDLQIGESTLYRLVRIGHHVGMLPQDVAEALSLSHHRALLGVSDGRHRQALARAAATEGWSVLQLEEAVKEKQPPDLKRTGRKPLPPGLKAFGAVARGASEGLDPVRFKAEFEGLGVEKQAEKRAEVLALAERVAGLVKVVRG